MTTMTARTPARPALSAWRLLAACQDADRELFFNCGSPAARKAARGICAGCPVRSDCLRAAMAEEHDPDQAPESNRKLRYGVRGGLTPRERWVLAYPGAAARERERDAAKKREAREK